MGSDADLVVVVTTSDLDPVRRPIGFDLSSIPVPADLIVYTAEEWEELLKRDDRFASEMRNVEWV